MEKKSIKLGHSCVSITRKNDWNIDAKNETQTRLADQQTNKYKYGEIDRQTNRRAPSWPTTDCVNKHGMQPRLADQQNNKHK